jgi:flagellar protein FliS
MTPTAYGALSYRRVATETATPGQRVAMLYDGAIRFLERALAGFQADDPLDRNLTIHNNIVRARDILHELNACLNLEAGGELAAALRRVYLYSDWRLEESNRRKDPAGIREIAERLTLLREAWNEMLRREETSRAA